MERYACGDDAAFAALHEGLSPRLRGFLLRLSGDSMQAADLTQETFLRIFRARGAFAVGAAVVPWAFAIARNIYLDSLRNNERTGIAPGAILFDEEDETGRAAVASTAGTGEQVAIAREAASVVKSALAAMPVAHREAFVLLRFEGLSIAEAAEVLGATETAVKLRAFRAYEAVRAALKKREEGR